MNRHKVFFVSLGCPKNQVDTEVMLGVTHQAGHDVVSDPDEADTLVVNTCGFIETAKQESIDTILELAQIKAEDPSKKLVVTGCLSQRYVDELSNELPEVDHFLGSADMLGLKTVLDDRAPRVAVTPLDKRSYLYDHTTPRALSGGHHHAYIKIAEGCDRPCAFCIIPKLRGPQRSRTIPSVVEEVVDLVETGTVEISLVAQDLTAYGRDLDPRTDLEHLLAALVRVDGLRWIRLHYAYPSTVSDPLIEQIAHEPKIATYLDVPIQHVDSDVLRKMRRGYDEDKVLSFIERLHDPKRVGNAHIWLRTTLLVGHPGETEAAFDRLYRFVAAGHIDHLGVFPWSREPGTAAALLPSRVDEALAQERAETLMAAQADLLLTQRQAMLGQELDVLVDGPSPESEFLFEGRHEGQGFEVDGTVVLTDGTPEVGTFVKAVVTQADAHDLVATLDPEIALEYRA